MGKSEILELWSTLPEAKKWSAAEFATRCVERPDVVSVHSHTTGEIFEVLSLAERRVLSEEEFSSELLQTLTWQEIH
jgi:hypothetical protein